MYSVKTGLLHWGNVGRNLNYAKVYVYRRRILRAAVNFNNLHSQEDNADDEEAEMILTRHYIALRLVEVARRIDQDFEREQRPWRLIRSVARVLLWVYDKYLQVHSL